MVNTEQQARYNHYTTLTTICCIEYIMVKEPKPSYPALRPWLLHTLLLYTKFKTIKVSITKFAKNNHNIIQTNVLGLSL